MSREPWFEIVRTDAPQAWHVRFRASNGRVVWSTENYASERAAYRAIHIMRDAVDARWWVNIRHVDERSNP
jgi:uncharacterized protein YegP (UPF0339 family)